jgi:hypothetical protein
MTVSRKSILFAAFAVLLAGQSAALGDAATPSTQPPDKAAADKPGDNDQIVCRFVPAVTGTRLGGRKECRTKLAWKLAEAPSAGKMGNALPSLWEPRQSFSFPGEQLRNNCVCFVPR